PLDELDRVVDQVRVEVLDLLLRELDFLEPGDDLVVGEEALRETFLDKLLKLLDLRQRDVDGEQRWPRFSGSDALDLPTCASRTLGFVGPRLTPSRGPGSYCGKSTFGGNFATFLRPPRKRKRRPGGRRLIPYKPQRKSAVSPFGERGVRSLCRQP